MQKGGPIIVIEDDQDDREVLGETFRILNYPNRVVFFSDGYSALEYLRKGDVHPFLILSDVNMPKINGFELRKKILSTEESKVRSVPYVFFTTGADGKAVQEAYAMSSQGFFIKPSSITELQALVRKVVDYWLNCYYPEQYAEHGK